MDTAQFALPNNIIIIIVLCLGLLASTTTVQCYSVDHSTTVRTSSSNPSPSSSQAVSGSLRPAMLLATTPNTTQFDGSPPHLDHNMTGSWNFGRNSSHHAAPVLTLCNCWQTQEEDTDLEGEELDECQCEGPLVVRISQLLSERLHRLTITSAGLKKLRKIGLKKYKLIQDLTMSDLPEFEEIEPGAFANLTQLRTIYITQAPQLQTLSADVFLGISGAFKSLRVINSGLITVPDLLHLRNIGILNMVDLEGNRITSLQSDSFNIKASQVILDNNELTSVDSFAFRGSEIAKLSLKGNTNLVKIHSKAFADLQNIIDLDLSGTGVIRIPHLGLATLERLRIQNTHSLKTIPSVLNFPDLQEAFLTHPFHCCAFKYPARHDPAYYAERQRLRLKIQKECADSSTKSTMGTGPSTESTFDSDGWGDAGEFWGDVVESNLKDEPRLLVKRSVEDISIEELGSSAEEEGIVPVTGAVDEIEVDESVNEEWKNEQVVNYDDVDEKQNIDNGNDIFHAVVSVEFHMMSCNSLIDERPPIKCYPIPDALNPCEDVMGSNWLRGSVWIVAFLAVFGNVLVLVVLLAARGELTVFKFLMCNLALADLCMGLYLFLLACIDVHSIEEYFNFAYDWQYGAGCTVAGVLTNFASHLSVFTLTIITLERSFAITNAIYLNRRLALGTAVKIMCGGWLYSILMACLPLVGMSNYSSTSICLPMEARDAWDVTYLVSLILTNGIAFLVIVVCYVSIYYSLGKETRRSEVKISQKMALLVFTNFVCWAPIAFFASTALAGYPLIDVAKSKILLVFFYPLNSCANPYLYAIMTSQYRKDLFELLSKFGLCRERALKYKMSISTNIPLIERLTKTPNGTTETGSTHILRKVSCESNL